MQRAQAMAGADRLVGGFRRQPRLRVMDMDESVQPGFQRGDARQMRVHHIHGRETFRGQAFRQALHGHCGKIGIHRPQLAVLDPYSFRLTMP